MLRGRLGLCALLRICCCHPGDKDPQVLQETLLALSQMPGEVEAEKMLPLYPIVFQ